MAGLFILRAWSDIKRCLGAIELLRARWPICCDSVDPKASERHRPQGLPRAHLVQPRRPRWQRRRSCSRACRSNFHSHRTSVRYCGFRSSRCAFSSLSFICVSHSHKHTGVGRTTPTVKWFESEIEARLWEAARGKDIYETYEDFARAWAQSQVIGKIAEERNLEAIAHIRTENVAQDMLRITEAHGYDKLQYWGFS